MVSNQNSKLSVAIIGTVIAGLCCASRLQARGFRIHVFKKSYGPSDRMSTRHSDS